jgi:hypothetical protein
MGVSGQHHAPRRALPPGKGPQYPLYRRPLFTKVPIKDTLQLPGQHFEISTIHLFWQVLTSTYFLYNGQFYHQTDVAALAPVVTFFYTEYFEQ